MVSKLVIEQVVRIGDIGLYMKILTIRLYSYDELYLYSFHQIKVCTFIQTAGVGVFAGRDFKQYSKVPALWRALFLPYNYPRTEFVSNYIFGYNKTNSLLVLDYGSLFNHHESVNVVPTGTNRGYFQVRMDFQCADPNVKSV